MGNMNHVSWLAIHQNIYIFVMMLSHFCRPTKVPFVYKQRLICINHKDSNVLASFQGLSYPGKISLLVFQFEKKTHMTSGLALVPFN